MLKFKTKVEQEDGEQDIPLASVMKECLTAKLTVQQELEWNRVSYSHNQGKYSYVRGRGWQNNSGRGSPGRIREEGGETREISKVWIRSVSYLQDHLEASENVMIK